MLYLGKTAVHSFGQTPVGQSKVLITTPDYSGSLYIEDACMVLRNGKQSGATRNVHMDRIYDWLNYSNVEIGTTPPPAGFEVEMTFAAPRVIDPWFSIWGARLGTSGMVTRCSVHVNTVGRISIGVSNDPAENVGLENFDCRGKKVCLRLIVLPTTSETYDNSYSARAIVVDTLTNQTVVDQTILFGDNFGLGNDAMFSMYTGFYQYHSGWFSRVTNVTPASTSYSQYSFRGWFYGGAVYLNPTGADTTIPTRVPIQILTPVKAGQYYEYKMPGTYYSGGETITADGLMGERIDIENLIANGTVQGRFANMASLLTKYSGATVRYID